MNRHRLFSALLMAVGIPSALLFRIYVDGVRSYYIAGTAIILLSVAAFILEFEGRKPQTAELVTIAALSAIAALGRMAFYALPQFKPIMAVIVISGLCFGGRAGCLVGVVSVFVSNFAFGQGPLTPWQMFGFGLAGFISGTLFSRSKHLKESRLFVSFIGAFLAFVPYGLIINPASAFTLYGNETTLGEVIASYISGFPFDLVHAVSTFLFLYVLYKPLTVKLERIKIKFGLMR